MATPTVPLDGKDTDRLARMNLAHKILLESESFLKNWPITVSTPDVFKQKIDVYQSTYEAAIHCDRRAIAARGVAAHEAAVVWQKIVNYACSTEQDNTELLERMGLSTKRRPYSVNVQAIPEAPDLSVVNVNSRGVVRASCPHERRLYTFEIHVTEGDPRNEEGWYLKQSFADCTNMEMSGFQSGKEYSFRCRIIGRNNVAGPWSHIITLMVT